MASVNVSIGRGVDADEENIIASSSSVTERARKGIVVELERIEDPALFDWVLRAVILPTY